MKCEVCHVNKATIHIQEVFDKNILDEKHLCQECAKNIVKFEDLMSSSNGNLEAILIKTEKKYKKSDKSRFKNKTCVSCGTSLKKIVKTKQIGCARCYEEFRPYFNDYLKYERFGTKHIGKTPKPCSEEVSVRQKRFELEAELSRVLKIEDYENAAVIRDSIAALDNK